jgi:sulfoxide reductase heme-binding subunit YedZ
MAGSKRRRWSRIAVVAACSVPIVLLASAALRGRLGANPIEAAVNRLGYWTLFFLLLALVPTPLRILFGWKWPAPLRRTLGLVAFTYACLHLATYVGVDQFFDLHAIVADVVKRRFITIGMLALALLVPLALTSTDRAVRRLGYVRWKRLHRLVYLAAVCGVVHFVWRVKADLREPLIFAGVLALLLAVRLRLIVDGLGFRAAASPPGNRGPSEDPASPSRPRAGRPGS